MGRKSKGKKVDDLLGESESESDEGNGFKINQEYAKRFEHNKRREDLHRLQERNPELAARLARGEAEAGEEEETSSSEDESGDDLISTKENEDMLRTLVKIKKKDPSIYEKDAQFYSQADSSDDDDDDDDDDGKASKKNSERKASGKSKNANTLRSIMARRALEEGAEALARDDSSDDEAEPGRRNVVTYNQEQEQIKRAFTDAANASESDDDSDSDSSLDGLQSLGAPKGGGGADGQDGPGGAKSEPKQATQALLDEYFGADKEMRDQDKNFLKDYIMNDGWAHKDGQTVEYQVDDEEDQHYLEQAEAFETKYNFRFEEPDSATIETFPRVIETSVRKKESKRKRQRDSKHEREAKRKDEEALEVKRLKNLKKQEIRDKLEEIRKVSGLGDSTDLDASLLEGDFDPDTFDASLNKIFNNSGYYAAKDGGLDLQQTGNDGLDQLFDEYDKIDYEDKIGDIRCRFKYKQVASNDFGFDAAAILNLSDAEMNQAVSKKALAPYSEYVPKKKTKWMVNQQIQEHRLKQKRGGAEASSERRKSQKSKDRSGGEAGAATKEERRADSYAVPTLGGQGKKRKSEPGSRPVTYAATGANDVAVGGQQFFNKGEKKRRKRAEKRKRDRDRKMAATES